VFAARAFSTGPEAQVMRNGEDGTVPSYTLQLMTASLTVIPLMAAVTVNGGRLPEP